MRQDLGVGYSDGLPVLGKLSDFFIASEAESRGIKAL